MPSDDDTDDPTPPAGRHVETLRDSQREARIVLDQQLATLSDIDDKAMRTVRFTLVLLGLALSAATIRIETLSINWFIVLGLVALSMAILFGLLTYSSSSPEVGPSTDYFQESYEQAYSESEWRTLVISGYVRWIGAVDNLNSTNARLLTICQAFLGIGVLLLTLGTVLVLRDLVELQISIIA